MNYLCLSESMWITHQNVLFGLNSDGIKFAQVVTANAGTSGTTEAVVGKTLTVQLQTP